MRRLHLTPLVFSALLAGAPRALAQSSMHRADFTTQEQMPFLTSINLSDGQVLSVFVDCGSAAQVFGASLVSASDTLEIPLVAGAPAFGEVALSDELVAAVRGGAAELSLLTSQGTLSEPITDIGTSAYGSGGSPSGAAPTLAGLGHAVANGTIALVANGLKPGRLGAFVFSDAAGAGEWAPGCPLWIGAVVHSELRVQTDSGREEWRLTLPPSSLEGSRLFAQYVEFDGSGVLSATGGVRIEVRRGSGFHVQLSASSVVTSLDSGVVVTSASIGPDGFADPATQTFFDATAYEGGQGQLPPAVMAHPALNVATAPLQGFVEIGSSGLDLADEEQRALIGGLGEVIGTWALGWETDGCTGIPFRTNSEECCDLHDMLYCIGGSEADRLAADIQLAQCILAHTNSINSMMMVFNAVQQHGEGHFNYNGPVRL